MNDNNINTLYLDVAQYKDDREKTAIYFRKKKITFYELNQRIDVMAKKLVSIGICKDMVVTLLAPNVPETIVALYALNKIGAIVSILHPLIPIKALTDSIRQTNSEYTILFDLRYPEYREELKNVIQRLYFISINPDLTFLESFVAKKKYGGILADFDSSKILNSTSPLTKIEQEAEVDTNQDAIKPSIYLRSGGTTGKSKTIILNDRAVRYPGSMANDILDKDIIDMSMVGVLPIFHGFGLAMGVHAPLMNHASSYLMMKFDADEIAKGINKNQINLLVGVPYMIEKLLANKKFQRAKLQNLYMTFVGADKPKENLIHDFDELMKKHGSINRLYEGYGLTEVVTVDVVNTMKEHKAGSLGKPLKGVKIKIVNPEDRRQELHFGEDGEILLSGINNCLGYLNCDKRHQPFFTDSKKITYVCTGDIGHVDSEGYLYFKNRNKDLIKIAGFNVFPSDIEALANQVEGVVDCAAVYVEGAHPYIHLYLENHSMDDEKLANEVMRVLKENLICYSLPEKVTCLPHFPRTAIGKIDRKSLIHF
jgi:long-chain acyl-CoA synthetase